MLRLRHEVEAKDLLLASHSVVPFDGGFEPADLRPLLNFGSVIGD